ncbi:Uncharacterised protein [Mycobacteroides abscessus subsp. abscessus]|nr:Uncharacterised protein [Mycobacteroides abscessus subsp. abscessus]
MSVRILLNLMLVATLICPHALRGQRSSTQCSSRRALIAAHFRPYRLTARNGPPLPYPPVVCPKLWPPDWLENRCPPSRWRHHIPMRLRGH